MVELEAQPQQESALEDPGRQVRVARAAADRAEQDRVVLPDLGEHGVRQHLAGGEVALGAQVVARRLELGRAGGGPLEHLQRLGGDLGADPVARDHGELDGAVREASLGGMRSNLVVVGPLAAVVSQVKRLLHGLGLFGLSGLFFAGPHSGYMSYIVVLLASLLDG